MFIPVISQITYILASPHSPYSIIDLTFYPPLQLILTKNLFKTSVAIHLYHLKSVWQLSLNLSKLILTIIFKSNKNQIYFQNLFICILHNTSKYLFRRLPISIIFKPIPHEFEYTNMLPFECRCTLCETLYETLPQTTFGEYLTLNILSKQIIFSINQPVDSFF